MKSEFSCRKATVADLDAIWRVRTAAIRALCKGYYSKTDTEAWASAPLPPDFADVISGRDFLVAECAGRIVGFGFINRQDAELEAIFVDPEYARRGTGTAILTSLEEIARSAGLGSLTLSSSLNAVPFYEAAGYQSIRRTTWQHPQGFQFLCVAMTKVF